MNANKKRTCIKKALGLLAGGCAGIVLMIGLAFSAAGNIGNTKHNFSSDGGGFPVQPGAHAQTEDQICIFCHTPHRALTTGPLWNHTMSNIATYTLYTSPTLLSPAPTGNKPDGDSLLCLGCHDGDQPVGAVQSTGGTPIPMTGTSLTGGKITAGRTTNFGSNLSGHHPISIEVSNCLVSNKATECTTPPGPISWKLVSGISSNYLKKTSNSYMPPSGYTCVIYDHPGTGVQCSSCHDAHSPNWMFLRSGDSPPNPWGGRDYADALCTQCHTACP